LRQKFFSAKICVSAKFASKLLYSLKVSAKTSKLQYFENCGGANALPGCAPGLRKCLTLVVSTKGILLYAVRNTIRLS